MKSIDELKFLLILLGCATYRSQLSASCFGRFKNKGKICQDLCDRELIDFSREIATVKILPAGQALLKLNHANLPITESEFKVLEKVASFSGRIKLADLKGLSTIKADEKQAILKSLSDRGLIEADTQIKRQRAEVWLTQRGMEFLRNDYAPKGSSVIQLDLLNNYLHFLRKTLSSQSSSMVEILPVVPGSPPDDDETLQTIQQLDQDLGTENYLPIFHLRNQLKARLTRDQLNQALYRLQRDDRIDLSALQESIAYTPEQIEAGIPRDVGGPLFFIIVN